MTSISSIDTSIYSGLIDGITTFSGRNSLSHPIAPASDDSDSGIAQVDLSSYYSNIRPEDLLSKIGNNVAEAAEAIDNAMVSALENGFTVQDACNIKLAQMAYRANCFMFKSTFKLSV